MDLQFDTTVSQVLFNESSLSLPSIILSPLISILGI